MMRSGRKVRPDDDHSACTSELCVRVMCAALASATLAPGAPVTFSVTVAFKPYFVYQPVSLRTLYQMSPTV